MAARKASIARTTSETEIRLSLDLDGTGTAAIHTGLGFFDHMLTLLAKHALFDLEVEAKGDIDVDGHHTVEDVGICLADALIQALGNKQGITRYGFALLPMEESLARVAVDISSRPWLEWHAEIPAAKCGNFDTSLGREFFRAISAKAGLNVHIDLVRSGDAHHALEAIFKGFGRALRMAVSKDPREKGIPSSKGVL